MLSVGPVVLAIRAITLLAWGVVIYDAVPWWPYLPESTARLVLGMAIVGTCHYLATRLQKSNQPAHEIYEAGKAIGRAQLLAEQASADAVVQLDDRRRLRDARNDDRQVVGDFWPL